MAFGLNFKIPGDLPGLEDDARSLFDELRAEGATLEARLRPALGDAWAGLGDTWRDLTDRAAQDGFDASAFQPLLDAFGGLAEGVELRNLDDLAALADRLPPELSGPDDSREVPTGSASVTRETAALGATLAAAPRIVEALGPDAGLLTTRGETFAVAETYRDPLTGFSALRLTPLDGGREVFAVDGLQVGSEADTVAAATLARLQVGSAAFAAMVADAVAASFDGGSWFTGPSLGGAVAQVAAYETAQAVLAAYPAAGLDTVRLTTVDPLGGRDAAEWLEGGALDPAALRLVTALNLRTDGDIVSRIGSHIGETLTLPALDEAGQRVELPPGAAHVNVESLLQVLNSDALYALGAFGPPAEIGAFAAASEPASDRLIAGWLAEGEPEATASRALQVPGAASLDATRTVWSLDADANGTVDLTVQLAAPLDPARADLVL